MHKKQNITFASQLMNQFTFPEKHNMFLVLSGFFLLKEETISFE
jgi:hypothetical protein